MHPSREAVEQVFKHERGRLLATLIRILGDIDLGEEALAAALEAALVQWPGEGTPANPRAWLIRTARNKAVDQMRRRALLEDKRAEMEADAALDREDAAGDFSREEPASFARRVPSREGSGTLSGLPSEIDDEVAVRDDQLRLIFTCCHPALAVEAQVALTLRTLCGLETEEIAHAFLVPPATMAQRLVRAKAKIRQAGIPYRVPEAEDLPERVDAVLAVVYLVFNEGYAASSGAALIRRELCAEAIRLARLLVELLPGESEVRALLALMLLTDARRDARVDAAGEMVLLEDQDRSLWDREAIHEGLSLIDSALRAGPPGAYALQAAIAGVHARAARAEETDWREIAALYGVLRVANPSGVVALNHAAAVAMADGPAAGLRLMDALAAEGSLAGYHLLPAARADLLRRLGRLSEAAAAYHEALALAGNETDRRFLEWRLAQVSPARA